MLTNTCSLQPDLVAALAEEYLACLTSKNMKRLEEIDAWFARWPLLAVEVLDEAFVVHKNRSNLWGDLAAQHADPTSSIIGPTFERYIRALAVQRGAIRPSATPTLKGGAQRQAGRQVPGSPRYAPFTRTLEGLEIVYYEHLWPPAIGQGTSQL